MQTASNVFEVVSSSSKYPCRRFSKASTRTKRRAVWQQAGLKRGIEKGCCYSCGRCFEMRDSENLLVCATSVNHFLCCFVMILRSTHILYVSSCFVMFDCSWFMEGCREVGLDTFPFSSREWRQCRDRMLEGGPDS